MDKQAYIKQKLLELTFYWFGIILLLGTFLFLALGAMDYFVSPAAFEKFFSLRVGISLVLLTFYFLTRAVRKRGMDPRYLLTMIVTAAFLSALTIEIMVLQLGGTSPGITRV